jgi:peptidoglycan hydrolase CwlO-like protein
MKLILITIVVLAGVTCASYFAGRHSVDNTKNLDAVQKVLQSEHAEIIDHINDSKNGIVHLSNKIDNLEKKLDILVKMATMSSPYLNDRN